MGYESEFNDVTARIDRVPPDELIELYEGFDANPEAIFDFNTEPRMANNFTIIGQVNPSQPLVTEIYAYDYDGDNVTLSANWTEDIVNFDFNVTFETESNENAVRKVFTLTTSLIPPGAEYGLYSIDLVATDAHGAQALETLYFDVV